MASIINKNVYPRNLFLKPLPELTVSLIANEDSRFIILKYSVGFFNALKAIINKYSGIIENFKPHTKKIDFDTIDELIGFVSSKKNWLNSQRKKLERDWDLILFLLLDTHIKGHYPGRGPLGYLISLFFFKYDIFTFIERFFEIIAFQNVCY